VKNDEKLAEVDFGTGKEQEDKIRRMMMILMMITTMTSVFAFFLLRYTKLRNC